MYSQSDFGHRHIDPLTKAVLDLINQSNRNCGALRMAVRILSYTFSLSNPSLCNIQICWGPER